MRAGAAALRMGRRGIRESVKDRGEWQASRAGLIGRLLRNGPAPNLCLRPLGFFWVSRVKSMTAVDVAVIRVHCADLRVTGLSGLSG